MNVLLSIVLVVCSIFNTCLPVEPLENSREVVQFSLSLPSSDVSGGYFSVPVRLDGDGVRSLRFSALYNPQIIQLVGVELVVPPGSIHDVRPDITSLRGSVIVSIAGAKVMPPGDIVYLVFRAQKPGKTAIRLGYARVNEQRLPSSSMIHSKVTIH